MGNLCSSNQYIDRDAVIRELWKSHRGIPVLPINSTLDALRVLNKKSDVFHDVGNVYSLCKPGKDKEWLKDVLYPQLRLDHLLPPTSISEQMLVISDDDGALAKPLVGPTNADAWFQNAESIQIRIPDCDMHELNMDKWAEMIQRFDPDLQTPTLGPPGRNGKRVLFIVQKVLLVSHIKITASYKTDDAGLELLNGADHPPLTPSQGINLEAKFRTTSPGSFVGEFSLSAAHKNQKLPVAFTGFPYTYDKFGNRDVEGKETQSQADAAGEIGESSAVVSGEEDDPGAEEEEFEEDDGPETDEHMGRFLVDNDWFATVMPCTDPSQFEILPRLEEEEEEAEPADAGEGQDDQEEEHVVDQNASGMEDLD